MTWQSGDHPLKFKEDSSPGWLVSSQPENSASGCSADHVKVMFAKLMG